MAKDQKDLSKMNKPALQAEYLNILGHEAEEDMNKKSLIEAITSHDSDEVPDSDDSVGHSSELPEDETPEEPIETETPDAPESEIVPKEPTSPKEPYENKEPVVIPDDEIPMEETQESSAVHNPKPADTPVEDVPPPHPKDEQAWSAIAARGGV